MGNKEAAVVGQWAASVCLWKSLLVWLLFVSAAEQIISQQQQDEDNQYPQHFIGQENHNCHSHCDPKQYKTDKSFHAITRKEHILLLNICPLPIKDSCSLSFCNIFILWYLLLAKNFFLFLT
jgi:hypothetical protein